MCAVLAWTWVLPDTLFFNDFSPQPTTEYHWGLLLTASCPVVQWVIPQEQWLLRGTAGSCLLNLQVPTNSFWCAIGPQQNSGMSAAGEIRLWWAGKHCHSPAHTVIWLFIAWFCFSSETAALSRYNSNATQFTHSLRFCGYLLSILYRELGNCQSLSTFITPTLPLISHSPEGRQTHTCLLLLWVCSRLL